MAIPLIAAVAAKTAGSLIGGIGASNAVSKGMAAYKNLSNQGIDTLKQGKTEANQAYSPYTQAGQTGLNGLTGATGNYLNVVGKGPDASSYKTTASGTQSYLDPSAAYSSNQASKTTEASAIAHGAAGGGLAKALSNNANKMAMANWNNAYNQQLQSNNQNFNQANQQWQNNYNAQNQNVANYNNLANIGLNATNSNQQLLAGYNSGINSNYGDQAAAIQSGWNAKSKIFNDTSNGIGDILSGGFLFGSAGKRG